MQSAKVQKVDLNCGKMTKRCGLDERLFTKCSECCHIVRLQSSKKCENRFSEINIRSVNAGIISGNGISNMQKIMSHLNFPSYILIKKLTDINRCLTDV